MTEPRDDETRPLPPDAAGHEHPAPAPPEPEGTPAWVSAAPAYAPVEGGPLVTDGTAAAVPPRRWSGRRTTAVAAAAVTLGVLGAVGAAAAVTQSDSRGGEVGHGQLGPGRGGAPGDDGARPDGGRGGPPPGGFDGDRDGDHHGPGDEDGFGDDDHGGPPPGPGGGTGSSVPGDANGTDAVLDT